MILTVKPLPVPPDVTTELALTYPVPPFTIPTEDAGPGTAIVAYSNSIPSKFDE